MGILDELSSQVGDRTEYSNRKVAVRCVEKPATIAEIVPGIKSKDSKLAGDAVEVLTMVAEQRPELVAPHAKALAGLLTSKTTRVRWEAMHALALVAPLAPQVIAPLLPQLSEMIRTDVSVIVRDYAVDAVANYARAGHKPAEAAYPYLKQALTTWDGKQAGHALNGLVVAAVALPKLRPELSEIGARYLEDRRGVVRKAANALVRAATGKSETRPAEPRPTVFRGPLHGEVALSRGNVPAVDTGREERSRRRPAPTARAAGGLPARKPQRRSERRKP